MNIEEQNEMLRRDNLNLRDNIHELKLQLENYRLLDCVNKNAKKRMSDEDWNNLQKDISDFYIAKIKANAPVPKYDPLVTECDIDCPYMDCLYCTFFNQKIFSFIGGHTNATQHIIRVTSCLELKEGKKS